MKDAYRQGFAARLSGDEVDANPYTKPSENWSRWAEGWLEQDRHMGDRDDALDAIGWFG